MKNAWWIFLIILTTEFLSFLSHTTSLAQNILFFLGCLTILVIALFDYKRALLIALAELFIGGFGYLFVFNGSGLHLSIRLGFFAVMVGVFAFKLLKEKKFLFKQSRFYTHYLVLALVISLGIVRGWLNNNNPADIFLDFNAFVFLGYLPIFYQEFQDTKHFKDIQVVFWTALTWLTIKTLFIYSIFVSGFTGLGSPFYKWIRDSGLGEITIQNNYLYRIFFQSQIYLVLAIIFIIIYQLWGKKIQSKFKNFLVWFLGSVFVASLIISLSRSYWVGLIIGLLVVWFYSWVLMRKSLRQMAKSVLYSVGLFFGAIFIITILTWIFHPLHNGFAFWGLLTERSSSLSDPAVNTRWSELRPLVREIKHHLFLGSGFGTTATFQSFDPRRLAENPSGLTSVYSFEWGWLDLWLKIGLAGLLIYVALLFNIICVGLNNFQSLLKANTNSPAVLNFFFAVSLIVVAIIHFFSPYLNHPLGLGWLIVASLFIENTSYFKQFDNHL